MLSSVFTTLVLTGLAASQAVCPIKSYDARPGYGLMCVRGDANTIYENELIEDVTVEGSEFDATVKFECVRQVGNAKWLGYQYANGGGKICYITEGNVEGEDQHPCFQQLPECDPARYDSGAAGEYVPPTPNAGAGGGFGGLGGLFAPFLGGAGPFRGFGGPEEVNESEFTES